MDNKVLDEAVEVALEAAAKMDPYGREWPQDFSKETLDISRPIVRAALLAGVKVLLGPVVAYEVVTPTDDPDVFDATLWAAAPGMAIPEGAIRLYAPSLGEGE